jgi:hypothetical protein
MPDQLVRIGDLRQRRPRMTLLPTRLTPTLTPQRLRRRLRQPIRRWWLRRITRIHPQSPLQLSNLRPKLADQHISLSVTRRQTNDQLSKLIIRWLRHQTIVPQRKPSNHATRRTNHLTSYSAPCCDSTQKSLRRSESLRRTPLPARTSGLLGWRIPHLSSRNSLSQKDITKYY